MDEDGSRWDLELNLPVVKGDKGDDGKSAYEIAVEHEYDGTEEEWLDSLKGKDGKDGQDGQDGKMEKMVQMVNLLTKLPLNTNMKVLKRNGLNL